jgi:hypothetical protein
MPGQIEPGQIEAGQIEAGQIEARQIEAGLRERVEQAGALHYTPRA